MAKANSSLEVVLTPDDIPGAEPYEQHSVAALRWWLLCRYYCPYISIWKVLQKTRVLAFTSSSCRENSFNHDARLSFCLGTRWKLSSGLVVLLVPHTVHLWPGILFVPLYQSCKQTLFSACKHVLDF